MPTILPIFFFKQQTAYEMRISDWSSEVCSSDLWGRFRVEQFALYGRGFGGGGFEIEGHGDAPKKMGHAPPPTGRWHAPWWEKRRRTVGEKRSADGQHLAPRSGARRHVPRADDRHELVGEDAGLGDGAVLDRKSTRLNSSH